MKPAFYGKLLGLALIVAIAYAGYVVADAQAQLPAPASACLDPGIQNYEDISDEAIEVRHLRAETYQNCQHLLHRLDAIRTALDNLADAAEDPTAPAQRVRLSVADRERLDLVWWGVWAAAGLSMCALFVTPVMRSFRFWRGDD